MIVLMARRWCRMAAATLLLVLFVSALSIQQVGATSHCVNPGGTGGCFPTIQSAIDDPGTVDGDTISVAPNNPLQTTYYDHVTVSKSVTIAGTDPATTIVDGSGIGTTFTIPAGKTAAISGLTAQGGGPLVFDNGGTLALTAMTASGGITNRDAAALTLTNVAYYFRTMSNGTGSIAIANSALSPYGSGEIDNNSSGTISLTNSAHHGGAFTGGIVNHGSGAVTVTGCTDDSGQGIANGGTGTVTVTDSSVFFLGNGGTGSLMATNITDSHVTNGGYGTTTVTHSTLRSLANQNGTLSVSNSTVRGSAENVSGSLILTNSRVTSIGGTPTGGGIFNHGGAQATFTNSTVDHSSTTQGGGILNRGIFTVTNSTFDHNTATDSNPTHGGGGGIYNDTGGTLTLINSTLSANTTSGSVGGGILNLGTIKVLDATISGNSVPSGSQGGGVANYASLTLANTIVAGNTASGGGPDVLGVITSGGHNLIGNTSGGSGFVASDLLNVNPLLAPLADNGGPTQTMALLPGSPAIGAGDAAICAAPPPYGAGGYDQRGLRRPAGSCSIGAYDNVPSSLPPTRPTAPPSGSPTALPPPRPTAPPPGAGTPTPNPLPPARP